MRGLASSGAAAALVVLTLSLNACVSVPRPEAAPSAEVIDKGLKQLRQQQAQRGFSLTGRIAVTGAALSGSLRWEQQADDFHLRIAGPFGVGTTEISGREGQVRVRAKGVDVLTDAPEQLLLETTGWPLPLTALRYWVLGAPSPSFDGVLTYDHRGYISSFAEQGWELICSEFRADGLPARLDARQGERHAVVLIQNLQLHTAPSLQ
jgi:outer membrane lipoprotein LolB